MTDRCTNSSRAGLVALLALASAFPAAAQDGGEARLLGDPVAQRVQITGGGPVIQILPGPAPFAQRALRFVRNQPGEVPQEKMEQMQKLARMGPFSNNVAQVSGDFQATLIDRGASGDEANGTATFTTRDGTQWRVVLTGVDPTDAPMEPHFGGVTANRVVHGTSGKHSPFVPQVNTVAMWGTADVFRGDEKVKENAPVHVMLSSHTRGPAPDFHYQCFDCVGQPMDELHLMLMPLEAAPDGFLHVMWESSSFDREPAR